MIFALALALFALPQEIAPDTQPQGQQQEQPEQKPSAEEIQLWWNGLSEKEQGEYRQRMKRFEELKPTLQEELGRRHGLLREERQRIIKNLSEAERTQFDALARGERRRFLDDRAKANMRERGQVLEQSFPGLGPPSPEEDWLQRRERVARVFEQQRAPQVRQAIAQAVADGWLGASAAKWLETAPIYEAMSALGEVRKWQFLQQASEMGLWEQMGFDEQRRREIAQMPAMEFFHTMRGHREGRQRGPGKFGEFGEHVGPGRGLGEGKGVGPPQDPEGQRGFRNQGKRAPLLGDPPPRERRKNLPPRQQAPPHENPRPVEDSKSHSH